MTTSPMAPTVSARVLAGMEGLGRQLRAPATHWRALCAVAALALPAALLWWGSQPAAVGAVGAGWDKLAHAGFHCLLCTLVMPALGWQRRQWAVPVCAAFAALDEFAQSFHPGRSVDMADVLASVFGALVALALAQGLVWWSEMRALQRRGAVPR